MHRIGIKRWTVTIGVDTSKETKDETHEGVGDHRISVAYLAAPTYIIL